jgi:hypothetical protein
MVVPGDPFHAQGRWKLSTHRFALLVRDTGLEGELRRLLQTVPAHVRGQLAVAGGLLYSE